MPTETFIFNENLAPFLQSILEKNSEIENVSYEIRPNATQKETILEVTTYKRNPSDVVEETILLILDKIKGIKNVKN